MGEDEFSYTPSVSAKFTISSKSDSEEEEEDGEWPLKEWQSSDVAVGAGRLNLPPNVMQPGLNLKSF